jgi:hypothetical protein
MINYKSVFKPHRNATKLPKVNNTAMLTNFDCMYFIAKEFDKSNIFEKNELMQLYRQEIGLAKEVARLYDIGEMTKEQLDDHLLDHIKLDLVI